MDLIKMQRHADGRMANVHPSMVDEYKAGGFRIVEPKPAGAAPVKRKPGRPRKLEG